MQSENLKNSGIEENQRMAQAIAYKFAELGINVASADIIVGAAVTRYTFDVLSKNTRMCNIRRCEDDLMAVTQSNSVMINAPINGTSMIGVEIANKTRRNVDLLTLLRSPEFINAKGELVFTVGEDIMGKPFIADLAKLPNLLIAGATGSGKTTLLHSLIVSLIYQYSPQYVRFVIAASNCIELAYCRTIPHLWSNSITMNNNVLSCMDRLIVEMESRYKLFRGRNVGKISEYNKLADGKTVRRLPYLVFIVDEFSQLMSENKTEFERKMLTLTQKSRAAGIHIVLATHRPDEKVLTGSIKANMTSRIALKVCSAYDSQRIIGGGGAEKLIGRGDMLFVDPTAAEFTRIQGAHISDEDIIAVIRHCIDNDMIEDSSPYVSDYTKLDEIHYPYGKAALRFWLEYNNGVATIPSLQRGLNVGEIRARCILEMLQRKGCVEASPIDELLPKELKVLVSISDLDRLFPDQD